MPLRHLNSMSCFCICTEYTLPASTSDLQYIQSMPQLRYRAQATNADKNQINGPIALPNQIMCTLKTLHYIRNELLIREGNFHCSEYWPGIKPKVSEAPARARRRRKTILLRFNQWRFCCRCAAPCRTVFGLPNSDSFT